jgi:putative membrane protein
VPLTNYAGWLLVSVLLMALLDALVGARPDPTDRLPYGLYLWTYASSVLGHAAFLGLPYSAFWGGLGMGTVAVPLALSLRPPAPGRPRPPGGARPPGRARPHGRAR